HQHELDFQKIFIYILRFFFSSRRRHTRSKRDWSSDVCSSDLGRFFCFFFLVKKRKVLKVLWFWSALPTASQSTHFMNIKYSVLYFTWKWLPERAKMPHICAT